MDTVIKRLKCQKCGYEWWPRLPDVRPGQCPNPDCRTALWDREQE